jgi:hypothetical protein
VSGVFPGFGSNPTDQALSRLEAAVERLAVSAARRPAGDGVPREAVERMAERLDEVVGRLRLVLGDEALRRMLGEGLGGPEDGPDEEVR